VVRVGCLCVADGPGGIHHGGIDWSGRDGRRYDLEGMYGWSGCEVSWRYTRSSLLKQFLDARKLALDEWYSSSNQ
jgi:hypothetical protein